MLATRQHLLLRSIALVPLSANKGMWQPPSRGRYFSGALGIDHSPVCTLSLCSGCNRSCMWCRGILALQSESSGPGHLALGQQVIALVVDLHVLAMSTADKTRGTPFPLPTGERLARELLYLEYAMLKR